VSGFEIRVDRTRCVGSGQCLIADAEHFAQDDEGYVVLLSGAVAGDLYANEDARDAVNKCPSGALSWRGRNTE
jgi:ferredoxin